MDFDTFTTDDLLQALPRDDEDNRWELKDAVYLEPSRKGELKKELGKQVSAFANTGGGYLVIGVSNDVQIQPCAQQVGRQTMKDFLANMVEQSVEYPIRDFRIHRVPFTSDPDNSIFVVAIGDSAAAPHQSKEDKVYYYRIDGHSKPAPHFHIELLRNRFTKSILRVAETDYVLQSVAKGSPWQLNIALNVKVENVSLQSATSWGVHAKHLHEHYSWTVPEGPGNLADGVCIHGRPAVLLPGETRLLTIHLVGSPDNSGIAGCLKLWENTAISLRPVSHNHASEVAIFAWDYYTWRKERERFKEFLTAFGVTA